MKEEKYETKTKTKNLCKNNNALATRVIIVN